MFNNIKKNSLLILSCLLLTACSGFFDKDNTPEPKPLPQYTAEIHPQLLWSVKTGAGTNDDYLKMNPVLSADAVYTVSAKGVVTSTNKITGHINWQTNTQLPVIAGPGAGDDIVVVGSRKGDLVALRQDDGKTLWTHTIPAEILANPSIGHGHVIVKAIDGYVRALSIVDGHEMWSFQQAEPSLILRGASSPLISDSNIIVGFANGNLAKIGLRDGQLRWIQTIAVPEGAFAIQRMIDIDANPVIHGHRLFAATYQGRINSLEWGSGQILWSHDISSYTGMIADDETVFISDARSDVWAFAADSGLVNWRQANLGARVVSGPASMGSYVVVGDAQGYLHWLSKRDGHFAGRVYAGKAIYAAPITENNVLYALTSTGHLLAYKISL